MNKLIIMALATLCISPDSLLAQAVSDSATPNKKARLIFSDDFERNESQETRDEIGKGWGSNSKRRAAGNKQVDLKNGAMYIYRHKAADHGVSVTHPAGFRNGYVELRFMLEDKRDSLGLNFADLKFKEVHAGHLFVAKVSTKDVRLMDLKTGNMDLKIRESRKANKLTSAQKKMLKTKAKTVRRPLETGKWHKLRVTVAGNKLSVAINNKPVAELVSEGIAHPTKRTLRLAVPRNAVVDDVQIYAN